ncbi:MAG: extracellular solute-binding protein [Syntrophothermus sp.]|uniref:ABC transporter substrate-binding protein n=1 Tax=Syntrophothermus sp. TaxID=2736299 RepID=UPI00257BD556|nr:extracellular solute-binding protein [Syntrophothermus sp.]NSW83168.1 extracellular solute-binding protein [Syntrophothermus sp.]
MKSGRLTISIALLLVLAAGLAVPVFAAEKVRLTFLAHTATEWNNVLKRHISRFEQQNPGVTVEFMTVPHKDLNTKVLTGFVSGTAPDIIGVYGPWMNQFVASGYLSEAPDWAVKDLKENFVPAAISGATFNGKVYGYPQHFGVWGPIANVNLYKKAGLAFPTTWEELMAIAPKMDKRKADNSFEQVGAMLNTETDGSWNVITWANILSAYGVSIVNEDASAAAFNTPGGKAATKVYAALSHPDFGKKAWDMFTLGRVGTYFHGSWTKATSPKGGWPFEIAALPTLKGDRISSAGYVWYWVVNNKTKGAAREAAWRLIQFMSQDPQYIEIYREINLPPMTYSLAKQIESDKWTSTFFDTLKLMKPYYSLKVPNWEEIDLIIGRNLEWLAAKEITVDQFLKQTENQVNKALKRKT